MNKPIDSAYVADEDDQEIELARHPVQEKLWTAEILADRSRKLKLHLVDRQQRSNVSPPTIHVNVVPNKAPEITQRQPTQDVQVSPLEELRLAASVWDDFGMPRCGVTYTIAGAPEREVVLVESVEAKAKMEIGHLMPFEDLQVEPDQLVTFYFWAEDFMTDGSTRRTAGDMYFAEVRKFDEIFREGQSPPGGQQPQGQMGGQNAQQAMELAELQKQIINATWKIIQPRESTKAFQGVCRRCQFADGITIHGDHPITGPGEPNRKMRNH